MENYKNIFLNKLKQRYSGKVSLVGEYTNSRTRTTFKCNDCGYEWATTPNKVLKTVHGCPKCSGVLRSTTEEFIAKAKLVHGNKYDYSKVNYTNNKVKVCIICPVHGEFWQTPHKHLLGNGCPKCSGVMRSTTEEFITKAKLAHGDKYDYSKVNYINNKTKVCIIHKDCGKEFWQKPNCHLSGDGCPFCFKDEAKTKDEFIKDARLIHGDKYDYSKVEYVNNKTKVEIICKKCGKAFFKTPNAHITQGQGCPECSPKSKGETVIKEWLIKHNIEFIHDKVCLSFLNKMRPDFYLPDYNLVIEYDGEQHFIESTGSWGKRSLLEIQESDREKDRLCFENNVEMLRIPYVDFKNIESILEKKLIA